MTSKAAEVKFRFAGWLQKYPHQPDRSLLSGAVNIGGQQPLLLNFNRPAPSGQRRGCPMSLKTFIVLVTSVVAALIMVLAVSGAKNLRLSTAATYHITGA
jgi:hypothetical protein